MKIYKTKEKKRIFSPGGRKKNELVGVKILFIAVSGIIIATAGYFLFAKFSIIPTMRKAWETQKPQGVSVEDGKILEQLSKIFLLPDDVAPTMAIVNDAEALKKSQPIFFANAKKGMRLIIYPTQAILFDAEANRIIKVGPVQLADSSKVGQVVFAIYNSTNDETKTAEMEEKIKSTFGNAAVSVKEKAAFTDYPETTVIDLIGNNPDIERIAEAVGGKVASLPEGEKKPEGVAVLVIIGK